MTELEEVLQAIAELKPELLTVKNYDTIINKLKEKYNDYDSCKKVLVVVRRKPGLFQIPNQVLQELQSSGHPCPSDIRRDNEVLVKYVQEFPDNEEELEIKEIRLDPWETYEIEIDEFSNTELIVVSRK